MYSFIVVNDNYFIIASDLYRRNYQTNSNKKSYKSVSPIVLQDEESNFSHNAEKPATYKRVSPKVLENYKQKHGDFFDNQSTNSNSKTDAITASSSRNSESITFTNSQQQQHGPMSFQSVSDKIEKGGGGGGGSSSKSGGGSQSSGGSKGGGGSQSNRGSKGGSKTGKQPSKGGGKAGGDKKSKGGSKTGNIQFKPTPLPQVNLVYRPLPKDELPYKVASTLSTGHYCDINHPQENVHLINPHTDPPSICSGDPCDPVMNKCNCKPEHFGDRCQHNKYDHIAFDLDCSNMGEEYVSSCLRQTHGGSCPDYRLVWDRLCYRTCTALPGLLCTPFVRQSYCENSPECPGLCNDLLDMYCVKQALGEKEEEVKKQEKGPTPALEEQKQEQKQEQKAKKKEPKFKCVNGKKVMLEQADGQKKDSTEVAEAVKQAQANIKQKIDVKDVNGVKKLGKAFKNAANKMKTAFSKVFSKNGKGGKKSKSEMPKQDAKVEDVDDECAEQESKQKLEKPVEQNDGAPTPGSEEQKASDDIEEPQKMQLAPTPGPPIMQQDENSKKNEKGNYKAGQFSASDEVIDKSIKNNEKKEVQKENKNKKRLGFVGKKSDETPSKTNDDDNECEKAPPGKYPTCKLHENSVWAFCGNTKIKKWGIGNEKLDQAVINCNYASSHCKGGYKMGTCAESSVMDNKNAEVETPAKKKTQRRTAIRAEYYEKTGTTKAHKR